MALDYQKKLQCEIKSIKEQKESVQKQIEIYKALIQTQQLLLEENAIGIKKTNTFCWMHKSPIENQNISSLQKLSQKRMQHFVKDTRLLKVFHIKAQEQLVKLSQINNTLNESLLLLQEQELALA